MNTVPGTSDCRPRRVVIALALAALATGPPAPAAGDQPPTALDVVRAAEDRRGAMLARLAPSIVCIFPDREAAAGGSGVIIDPGGYGLTNFHVIAPCLESRRGYGGLADGQLYPLEVLGIDPGGDIAMFKLEGKQRFDHAALGDSDQLHVGQWVAALGNPFALSADYTPTVTVGVISGLHRYQYGQGNLLEYADCIQVSTSINPGNSGGPVVDMDGRVVGIAGRGSFAQRGRVNVGLGYAVSVNQIKRFLPALRAGRLCRHGTLGATVQPAADDLIFGAVQAFSPAEQAGVELGDVLLAVNGRPVRTPNEYNNAMAVLPADWPVVLALRRNGRSCSVRTRLEPLPLRDMPVLIPDRAQNLAAVLRVFELYAEHDRRGAAQRFAAVTFDVRLATAGTRTNTIELRVVETGTASLNWHDPDDRSPPDAFVCREWSGIIGPLLWRPQFDHTWELVGGDEVAGRIVSVVEQRLDAARRIRWKFDLDSHELAQVALGDAQQAEATIWTSGGRRTFDQWQWPAVWHRSSASGEVEIHVETFEPEPAPVGSRPGEGG